MYNFKFENVFDFEEDNDLSVMKRKINRLLQTLFVLKFRVITIYIPQL